MEENSIPNKETRGSSLEKRELFPNEEEYANDTELECVEHIGDFHVYRDAKGDRLYVVHVSGFVAGYGFGNLWSRSHRGYPDKAEREKEKLLELNERNDGPWKRLCSWAKWLGRSIDASIPTNNSPRT